MTTQAMVLNRMTRSSIMGRYQHRQASQRKEARALSRCPSGSDVQPVMVKRAGTHSRKLHVSMVFEKPCPNAPFYETYVGKLQRLLVRYWPEFRIETPACSYSTKLGSRAMGSCISNATKAYAASRNRIGLVLHAVQCTSANRRQLTNPQ